MKNDAGRVSRPLAVAALGCALFVASVAHSNKAIADCSLSGHMSSLVGYTIIAEKTIQGTFNGCNYNQPIVFTDNTMVHCSGYQYVYAYQPDVYLLGNGSTYYMCIDTDLIEIQR
jgi:hypothetical protein